MTNQFEIAGHKGEKFTVKGLEKMHDLKASKAACIKSGKHPARYVMERVIEGTRKKAMTIYALRFKKSGNFISAY